MLFKKLFLIVAFVALPFTSIPVAARDVPDDVQAAIEASLRDKLEGETALSIAPTPMAGMYVVRLAGGRYLYASGDGSHMIAGEMYDFAGKELVNLTEKERMTMRRDALGALQLRDVIVFSPQGKPKAILHVFTDVDCGYCRLFHQQVPDLNSKGVEIRYLAYPRKGLESLEYAKMATAWCADDRQQTLTDLKNDKDVEVNICRENPVAAQFRMGNEFGVRGTPSLVLMDGTLIPGYKPAGELLAILGLE